MLARVVAHWPVGQQSIHRHELSECRARKVPPQRIPLSCIWRINGIIFAAKRSAEFLLAAESRARAVAIFGPPRTCPRTLAAAKAALVLLLITFGFKSRNRPPVGRFNPPVTTNRASSLLDKSPRIELRGDQI